MVAYQTAQEDLKMWTYEHSIETGASPESIWPLYADVPAWPRWDQGLEWVTLNGPFAGGSTGNLKVPGQDPLPFKVLEVRPLQSFSDETYIPGLAIRFDHFLEPTNTGKTRITHRVIITGPAADEAGPNLGPQITADVPEAMESLARLALQSVTPSLRKA
ncbi:MAG TPA: SRPBCC family protein [Candidatus Dormibacteraeota bacterium]|nr:SRPBCC family protein [Candidatus Dormibacteraeota bacterium]